MPCAMWQSSYAKDQVCIIMDSFKNIMFLSFVYFLCVQVSMWLLILMIICHIRNLYTWESANPSLISVHFLPVLGIVSFWFFDGSGKRMSSECLYLILISLHSWVFGYILHPFLAWWSYWILLCTKYVLWIFWMCDPQVVSSCCIAPPYIHKWVCAFDSTHIW